MRHHNKCWHWFSFFCTNRGKFWSGMSRLYTNIQWLDLDSRISVLWTHNLSVLRSIFNLLLPTWFSEVLLFSLGHRKDCFLPLFLPWVGIDSMFLGTESWPITSDVYWLNLNCFARNNHSTFLYSTSNEDITSSWKCPDAVYATLLILKVLWPSHWKKMKGKSQERLWKINWLMDTSLSPNYTLAFWQRCLHIVGIH